MNVETKLTRRTGRVCRSCERRYYGLQALIVRDFGLCPACRARHAKPSPFRDAPEPTGPIVYDLPPEIEARRLALRSKIEADNAAGISTLSSRSRIAQLSEPDWFTEQDDTA